MLKTMDFITLCLSFSFAVLFFDSCNGDGVPGSTKGTTSNYACEFNLDPSKLSKPKGPKGEKGEKRQALATSIEGEIGPSGDDGKKGDTGSIGPAGINGNDRTCTKTCFPPEDTDDDDDGARGGEAHSSDPKDSTNASPTPCHLHPDSNKIADEKIWVHKEERFQVVCKNESNHLKTCLFGDPSNTFDIEANAINYKNESIFFWLSDKQFKLLEFYKVDSINHLKWLQNNVNFSRVTQKIRYHCKNSYVAENTSTALRMFGWTDMLIIKQDDESDLRSSLTYNLSNHKCKGDAPKDKWVSTDIEIESENPRSLPVIDFQIRDIRNEDQSVSLQLIEICFG